MKQNPPLCLGLEKSTPLSQLHEAFCMILPHPLEPRLPGWQVDLIWSYGSG